MEELLPTIVDSIINKTFVLVLGPDIYIKEVDGKAIQRNEYFQSIEKEIESCIYFPNEGVFDFKDDDEYKIKNRVKDFYTNGGDANILELIASLRIPLIINASPDNSLESFCLSNGLEIKHSYFGDIKLIHPELNFENPLIYNVLGDAKNRQDLILDFHSLFEHIQKIIQKNAFPDSIGKFLFDASCFLFIGFKFESWAYQLISHTLLNYIPSNMPSTTKKRLPVSSTSLNKNFLQQIKKDRESNKIKSTNIDKDYHCNIIMASAVSMKFSDSTPAQLLSGIVNSLLVENIYFIRDVTNQEKYSAYLSYKHFENTIDEDLKKMGSLTRQFVELFQAKTQNDPHLKFIVDKDELHYGQSIDSFMTRIGKGKTVIIIISDNYLKSKYCMTEMIRIFKYNNEDKRAFAIVIVDNISKAESYEKFWKEKAIELVTEDKSNMLDINSALEFSNEFKFLYKKLEDIKYLPIKLSDIETIVENEYRLTTSSQQAIDKFTEDIIYKLKE
ncbi:MAG: hypothetical protein JWQ09_1917 [Segetibacter sp.]|nr:hypothetical protein [Segetibacter sp.]